MKNKKRLQGVMFILSAVILFFVSFSACTAIGIKEASNKLETGYSSIYGKNPVTLTTLIGSIIQIILSLLGLVFFVLTFYGGYIWMLAKGDEKEVERAQGILTTAIIGLLIVVASYAITYFVFSSLTKASGVNF